MQRQAWTPSPKLGGEGRGKPRFDARQSSLASPPNPPQFGRGFEESEMLHQAVARARASSRGTSSERPVIAAGFGRPISSSKVGATSASLPSTTLRPRAPTTITGTRFSVCAVRLMGRGIGHRLGIAVVGGDQNRAALGFDRGAKPPEATVDRFHRLDGGVENAAMAHHVGVGEVDDDQVEAVGLDRRHQLVGHFVSRHLGLEIVSRDLGRGHQDALLAREQALLAAVEEEGDVRVFLGLGDAQLL